MKLSIVIPAFNEEASLRQALEQVAAALEPGGIPYEIIVVDDGSTDRTWPLLEQLSGADAWRGRLRGVRFSRNFGKEAAIFAGLREADGDAVVVMDADLQHPPALIPRMIELWSQRDYGVVEGVKANRQREPASRRLAALLFYRVIRAGAGLDLDASSDFKLLDRRVVDAYLRMPESGRFFRGMTAWIGLPTARVEFEVPERVAGGSAWRLGALADFARSAVVSFTALPLRLISWVGLFGLLASIALAGQTLWNKLFGASAEGFPTVIILILGMGSLILLCLGIIGEYLSELYREVKRRPLYVVQETLEGSTGGSGRSSEQPVREA